MTTPVGQLSLASKNSPWPLNSPPPLFCLLLRSSDQHPEIRYLAFGDGDDHDDDDDGHGDNDDGLSLAKGL